MALLKLTVLEPRAMKKTRAVRHYVRKPRPVLPEQLEQLKEIVKENDLNTPIEAARMNLAAYYESLNVTPMPATDENAENFVRMNFIFYLAHFGQKPVDVVKEIDDVIYFLEGIREEEKGERSQRHYLVNKLIDGGACWGEVDSPLNVGALVIDGWVDMPHHIREGQIKALQAANNTWNSNRKIRRNIRKLKGAKKISAVKNS